MATEGNQIRQTMIAGTDLSAKQYHFVTLASDGQIDPTGAGLAASGVLVNDPVAAGRAATVVVFGRTKVVAGGSVAAGDLIQSDANGQAVTRTASNVILGKAVEAAVAGQIFTIDFQVNAA